MKHDVQLLIVLVQLNDDMNHLTNNLALKRRLLNYFLLKLVLQENIEILVVVCNQLDNLKIVLFDQLV